jgi:hypothetical protein
MTARRSPRSASHPSGISTHAVKRHESGPVQQAQLCVAQVQIMFYRCGCDGYESAIDECRNVAAEQEAQDVSVGRHAADSSVWSLQPHGASVPWKY